MTKRILVVSTDPQLGQSRALLLQSQGYKVDYIATDDEAMRMLESIDFDLVLLAATLCSSKRGWISVYARNIRSSLP